MIVLASESLGDTQALQFLKALSTELEDNFENLLNDGSATFNRTSMEASVQKVIQVYGKDNSKLGQARTQINHTANKMKQNISSLMDNNVDLEKIDDDSNNLRNAANLFSQRGRELERKLRWRNKLMLLLIGGGAFVFILFICFLLFG